MNYKQPAVYFVTNKKGGTIYTGVTSNLAQRIYQHKSRTTKGFAKKYNCDILVYYEIFEDMYDAIKREKRLKFYQRQWKIDLIEKDNPQWQDLFEYISN